MSSPTAPARQERFVFIDALRGVAALAVLYHHMLHNSIMEAPLRRIMPLWSTLLSDWGRYGVQIFFVLSGFVITHSLRNSRLDGRSVFNFVLRRQLRLDPPYWCTVALVLIVQAVRLYFPRLVTPPLPGVGAVLLNLVYLQNIFCVPQVFSVAWTLCIEIQFYLFFILILGGAAAWADHRRQAAASSLVFLSGCASLAAIFLGDFHVWFVQYWYHFAAGALCYWAIQSPESRRLFYIFATLFVGSINVAALDYAVPDPTGTSTPPQMATGLLTAGLIFAVGRAGRLTTLWSNRIIQYFGRISYSLYLVHLTVAVTVLQAGYKLTGENLRAALGWFVLSGLASIAVGHVLCVLVERPCMRLASSLRNRPKPGPVVVG